MNGFITNIEEKTQQNTYFRHVLFTGQHVQLVLMCLNPDEEIGFETHEITDQFLRIESGEGKVTIDGEEKNVKAGDVIVVPAKTKHNLVNTSQTDQLKLYTVYAPPHHKDGIIHKTKAEASKDTQDHV